jgi:hypothetical protein
MRAVWREDVATRRSAWAADVPGDEDRVVITVLGAAPSSHGLILTDERGRVWLTYSRSFWADPRGWLSFRLMPGLRAVVEVTIAGGIKLNVSAKRIGFSYPRPTRHA